MDLDSIREEASRYALTTKLLSLILDELKKALLANKNLILIGRYYSKYELY